MSHSFIFVCLTILTFKINAQHIVYLNGLYENSSCEVDTGIYGRCRKMSDCMTEFDNYRNNQTVLKVCSFDSSHSNTLICCHDDHEELESPEEMETFEDVDTSDDKDAVTMNPKKRSEVIDFTTCRQRFLRFRKQVINIEHFEDAFWTGQIPKTEENCIKINNLNKKFNSRNFWDGAWYGCAYENDEFKRTKTVPHFSKPKIIRKGLRPNMATIGITKPNGRVKDVCGGSILTPRFVVTAAHCEFHEKKKVDSVRVGAKHTGPKNNKNQEQQTKIRKFIVHPDYKPSLAYNDIAVIKTAEKINFNRFIVPSCIADLDAERKGIDNDWTIGGYGPADDGPKQKVILELKVDMISNGDCSKSYSSSEFMPNGIIESQFCAGSPSGANEEMQKNPDDCFGEPGSLLQYNTAYEIYPKNYSINFLSKYFLTSNIIGIANFRANCGLETPFVFTKISYYVSWIKAVIESH